VIDEKPKLPSPWERLDKTRAQLAAERGISVRTLQRQFADEREREARYQAEAREKGEWLDPYDFRYMELVTDAPDPEADDMPHDWATTDGSEASQQHGRFHIGGKVKSLRGGMIVDDPDDGECHPTSYTPDPVLKGGVG
jgi:hypothetical protein